VSVVLYEPASKPGVELQLISQSFRQVVDAIIVRRLANLRSPVERAQTTHCQTRDSITFFGRRSSHGAAVSVQRLKDLQNPLLRSRL
jgi:hypothetical protein